MLVGVQLALTALWRSYGVEPDAVIGHSMGEVSAAVVAGALSPAEGLRVIATRSRLMARLAGQGAMALLELDAEAAEALIADYPEVTVAVYAAPQQTVIAGPPEQVDAVIAVVDAQDRLARRIEVDVASHHPTMDPILPELRSGAFGFGAGNADDSVDQHRDGHCGVRAGVRCGLLGGQSAQSGAVQPGRGRRGAKTTRRSWRSARTRCSPTPSATRFSQRRRPTASSSPRR